MCNFDMSLPNDDDLIVSREKRENCKILVESVETKRYFIIRVIN